MRARTLSKELLATAIIVFFVMFMMLPKFAHAAGLNCNWTGAGDGTNFSDATNWSNCNSAAPVNGSNLIFDNTSLISFLAPFNDLTNLSIGSMTFSGSNSSSFGYSLSGNQLFISSGIVNSSDGYVSINLDLNLTANQSFVVQDSLSSTYYGSESTSNLIIGNHTLNISSSVVGASTYLFDNLVGSGNVNFTAPLGGYSAYLNEDASSFGGIFNFLQGVFNVSTPNNFSPVGNVISSNSEAVLTFFNGETVSYPITISGSGVGPDAYNLNGSTYIGGAINTIATTGYSGSVTLSNVTLSGDTTAWADSGATMTFTILSSNGHSLISSVDSLGTLVGGTSGSGSRQSSTINSGNNLPSQPATVSDNQELILDGVRGATTVNDGAVLKGSGTMSSLDVDSSGLVAPGHSPGCLNVTGNLNEGGIYQAELGGIAACIGYDQLVVSGSVILDNGGSPATQGHLQILLVNGFKPTAGQTFEIINNQGSSAVTNTFANYPEGSQITASGYKFNISYTGGDGNDVVLTVVDTPSAPNTGFEKYSSHTWLELVVAGLFILGFGTAKRQYSSYF